MLQQNGFSLFEILITLTIAIIMLAISIPAEKIFISKSNDELMSQQLLRAIYLARSEAITYGVETTLCKSANLQTCSGDWLQGYIIVTDDGVLDKFQNPTNKGIIYFRVFPEGRTTLQFSPSGYAEVENGTFWYCEDAQSNPHWSVVISQSGRARLVMPDANGEIMDGSGKELTC